MLEKEKKHRKQNRARFKEKSSLVSVAAPARRARLGFTSLCKRLGLHANSPSLRISSDEASEEGLSLNVLSPRRLRRFELLSGRLLELLRHGGKYLREARQELNHQH